MGNNLDIPRLGLEDLSHPPGRRLGNLVATPGKERRPPANTDKVNPRLERITSRLFDHPPGRRPGSRTSISIRVNSRAFPVILTTFLFRGNVNVSAQTISRTAH
jgi:hypothetical protein